MGHSPNMYRWVLVIGVVLGCHTAARPPTAAPATVVRQPTPPGPHARAVKVTVLSTMLAGNPKRGIGEWGFAALLEVDGHRILFDTGSRPETVLRNAAELDIDLSDVADVILTHNHEDHIGGLLTLRRELMKRNPIALGRAHVAPGIFAVRLTNGGDNEGLAPLRAAYEATGGKFVEHAAPTELNPGVWFTGPVPRPNRERNWSGDLRIAGPNGPIEDTIPEDSSIVVDTEDGLIVLTGCAHAGIINISEYARSFRGGARIVAVLGGLHLLANTDEQLAWTGGKLREFGVAFLLGAHCTGIEAVFRLRERLGLTRETAVVGAVGATFTLGAGIAPLALAK